MTSDNGKRDREREIAFACEAAILRFTAHFDAGEYLEMESYFAPQGVWKRHDGDIVGREDLRKRLAQRKNDRVMRHVISNVRTTVIGQNRARVDSYVTVYLHVFGAAPRPEPAPLPGPDIVGRYHDELELIGNAWQITFRHAFHDFKSSPNH